MLQKIINFGIYLIALSLPLYLVRLKIFWIPTTFLELMIYGLFIVWLVSRIKNNQILNSHILNSKFQLPILLLFFGATLSTLFSVDIITSAGIWKGWFVDPLLYLIVVISSLKTKESSVRTSPESKLLPEQTSSVWDKQVKNILIALILSGAGVALVALFYWARGQLTYDGRLRAFYLSPNHLAMYLSPILILSLYLYFCLRRKFFKILLFIVHCSLFMVIYLTFSYGAWLAVVAALFFLLVTKAKSQKFIYYLAGFILLLVVLSFIWQMPSQKFQTFLNFSRSSLESRLMIWRSALEIIKDHPLVGIGPGMFQKYYLDYQSKFRPYLEWAVPQPHNLFLAFWLQTGLLGLVGFGWLLVRFFRGAFKKLFTAHCPLVTVLVATMIYILVHGLVDTPYWKNDLSIIFWLITALNYKASHLFY